MSPSFELRLAALERQNRNLRRAVVATAASAGIVATMAAVGLSGREPPPRLIEAQGFNLVDKDGKVRAALIINEHGPRLRFKDDAGKDRASIGFNDGDGPFLGLLDPDEKPRVAVFAAAGQAGMQVLDEAHVTRAHIAQTQQGAGLWIYDSKGANRANLANAADGTFLSLSDANDNPRVRAVVADKGAAVQLLSASKALRAEMSQTEQGTGLSMRDSKNITRVDLGTDMDGPQLVLNDANDNARVLLAAPDQGGVIQLRDDSKVIRANIGQAKQAVVMSLSDEKGVDRVKLGSAASGPIIALSDEQEHDRLQLTVRDDLAAVVLRSADEKGELALVRAKDSGALRISDKDQERLMIGSDDTKSAISATGPDAALCAALVCDNSHAGVAMFDKDHHDRARLSLDPDGASVRVSDDKGRRRIALGQCEDCASLAIGDADGHPRIEVGYKAADSFVKIRDSGGAGRIAIAQKGDYSLMSFLSDPKKESLLLAQGPTEAGVWIFAGEKPAVRLEHGEDGPALQLIAANKDRTTLWVPDSGPTLRMGDGAGKRTLELTSDAKSTGLFLRDSIQTVRAGLGLADPGAFIYTCNEMGSLVWESHAGFHVAPSVPAQLKDSADNTLFKLDTGLDSGPAAGGAKLDLDPGTFTCDKPR